MFVRKNTIVATMLLFENLEMPQIPWPLVHPLPTFVPIPTKIPAATTLFIDIGSVGMIVLGMKLFVEHRISI